MRPIGAPPSAAAGDRHWNGTARFAISCALTFGTMTVLIDWDAGTLTPTRALLWLTLSTTVLIVLLPPRVTAGPGWLAVRDPIHRRIIHTDALIAVEQHGTIASRLALRDTHGNRLELDPRVLITNPFLWHELDTGVRHSLAAGTLRQGTDVLRDLGHLIDDETAQSVLKASEIS